MCGPRRPCSILLLVALSSAFLLVKVEVVRLPPAPHPRGTVLVVLILLPNNAGGCMPFRSGRNPSDDCETDSDCRFGVR